MEQFHRNFRDNLRVTPRARFSSLLWWSARYSSFSWLRIPLLISEPCSPKDGPNLSSNCARSLLGDEGTQSASAGRKFADGTVIMAKLRPLCRLRKRMLALRAAG